MVIGAAAMCTRVREALWPGSRVDVVEIDPRVTAAAKEAFGLPSNTTINTINLDARTTLKKLLSVKTTVVKDAI